MSIETQPPPSLPAATKRPGNRADDVREEGASIAEGDLTHIPSKPRTSEQGQFVSNLDLDLRSAVT